MDSPRVGAPGPAEKGLLIDDTVRDGDRDGVGADISRAADVVGFYHPPRTVDPGQKEREVLLPAAYLRPRQVYSRETLGSATVGVSHGKIR